MLAGYFIPDRLAHHIAEADLAIALVRLEEDAPAVVGHFHVVEVRPAVGFDADGGAQVDLVRLEAVGTDFLPPLEEIRLPLLERALQPAVGAEIDVVGDGLESLCHVRFSSCRTAGARACRTWSARRARRSRWGG